jgi:outer membrane protein assembly factor BamB
VRRRFLELLASVAALAGAAYAAAVAAAPNGLTPPAAWTQFRLADSNNVVIPGTLQARWRLNTGGPYSSSPAIAGGILYADDNNGQLSAIDPQTGRMLWKYRAANPLMSAPIVYGNAVIVGEGDENSPQGSSPSHPILVGKPPSALLAFDRATGALLWRVALPGSGMPTPAIIDGILVHHDGAGHVLGIDPATGRILYEHNLHSIASMVAALPMPGGRFVTGGVDANAVWMLNAKDGSVVWESPFSPIASGVGDCPPVSDGARIYCNYIVPPSSAVPVQTERAAKLRAYAIDARTGRRVWDTYLETGMLPKRNEAAIPLLAGSLLYMGSSVAPYMHALDPQTGALRWRTRVRGPVLGGIVDTGGTLYFGDFSGYLWALDANSGAVIGDKNMHAIFNVGSPIVAGQTLIIGTRGGSILTMPLSSIRSSHDA